MLSHRANDVNFRALQPDPWLCAALVLCVAVRLLAWAAAGPTEYPDTSGYVAPATVMASGTAWLWHADPGTGPGHAMLFRMAGYPLLIAAAQGMAGPHWPHLIVLLQAMLSMAAAISLFRLARTYGAGPAAGFVVVLVHGLTLSPMFDIAILTDSPFASLVILAVAIPARAAGEGRELGPGRALVSGLLLAAAFLMREVLEVLVLALVPALAILAARSKRYGRATVAALLVIAPTLLAGQLYRAWNGLRSGLPILTSGQSGAYLVAVVDAARYDRTVLDGLGVYSPALQQEIRSYEFTEIVRAREIAQREYGLSVSDATRHAKAAYWLTWRRHPEDMVRAAAGRLFAFGEVWDPFATYLATNDRRELARAAFRLVDRLLRLFVAFSAAIGLAFALVRLKSGNALAAPAAGLALWIGGFTFALLMIHIEARYVIALFGMSAVLLLWAARTAGLLPDWLAPRTAGPANVELKSLSEP